MIKTSVRLVRGWKKLLLPVRLPRRPSTIKNTGFKNDSDINQGGKFGLVAMGKNAEERNNSGMNIRFIMSGNPWKSCILEARMRPKPTAVNAMRSMNTMVNATPKILEIGIPRPNAIARMMKPCMRAVVAPPSVRPMIMERRLIGATRTSWRNPNCLSQRIDMPVYIDENKSAMAMIPGAIK